MNVIVAVDEAWGIGKDGDQLVYLSADLRRFKELTLGHPVILGRKTLSTFPGGRPLKGRRNLILSRDPDFHPEGAEVYRDLDALLAAGLRPMRYAEPPAVPDGVVPPYTSDDWADDPERLRAVPTTLVFVAQKPRTRSPRK